MKDAKKRASDEYIEDAGNAYASTKKSKKNSAAVTVAPSWSSTGSVPPVQTIMKTTGFSNNWGREKNGQPPSTFHQQTLDNTMESYAESQLTMAIADLIHSCGLPFSLASHHKFQRVLTLAKNVPKSFQPPCRNKVSGELLDLNYQLYKQRMMELLEKDADIFGLTYFGDGATVKKAPLINILASSVHLPVACLRIVDCTGHLQASGRKDASYIADLFMPHISAMEERAPKSTDLVIFDGASNVQKAGRLLEAKYPHISVVHGAEHVISLFYHDVFKLPEFDVLKSLNRSIYQIFGSGAMHSPYALFSKQSRDHNCGKNIGLIRAADTRMAGHVISMLRTLRLKHPLQSTITSAAFLQGKFNVGNIHARIMLSESL